MVLDKSGGVTFNVASGSTLNVTGTFNVSNGGAMDCNR